MLPLGPSPLQVVCMTSPKSGQSWKALCSFPLCVNRHRCPTIQARQWRPWRQSPPTAAIKFTTSLFGRAPDLN